MSQIRFFKVPSKGKLQDIDASIDSLHARRVLIVEDKFSSTYWIISGKNASATAIKNADQHTKKMIKGANSKMKSSTVDYDDARDHLNGLLSRTSKSQSKKIPLVPNSASKVLNRKSVKSSEGPVIKEFEIAYYKEETSDKTSDVTDQIESLLAKYSDEIHQQHLHPTTKAKAKKKLNGITTKILSVIFS